MTRPLSESARKIVEAMEPLSLKDFTEKMLKRHPELPKEEVIRRAKEAVAEEYRTRKAQFLS